MDLSSQLEKTCAKHLLQDLPGIACFIKQAYCPQESLGFTLQQMRLLSFLKGSSLSTTELADKLNVSLPAISRMTQMMIDTGWVEKTTSKEDRRQIHLDLTIRGKTMLRDAEEESFSRLLPQLKKLKENDKKALIKAFEIIEKLINNQNMAQE